MVSARCDTDVTAFARRACDIKAEKEGRGATLTWLACAATMVHAATA